MWTDIGDSILGLRRVLRIAYFDPGDANRLGFPDRLPKTQELRFRKKPLLDLFAKLLNSARWICHVLRQMARSRTIGVGSAN